MTFAPIAGPCAVESREQLLATAIAVANAGATMVRGVGRAYRFTLDLAAVPVLKERTHLPVILDPSHAAGRRDLVRPLSDGAQALTTAEFANYAYELRAPAQAIRGMPTAA